MSGWKGGGLLLVLAVPLALYAAWKVKDVVRTDMVVSSVPPDRGGTKEQLAATKAKAATLAGDAQKASRVALLYKQAGPDDRAETPVAAATTKAATARAAVLSNLDLLLGGNNKPDFVGDKDEKAFFNSMHKDSTLTNDARAKIETYNANPVSDDAGAWMKGLEGLLTDYLKTGFHSRGAAAMWRIEGRLKVIDRLAVLAEEKYPKAIEVPLSDRSADNALTAAVALFNEVERQVENLGGDAQQAVNAQVDPAKYQAEIDKRKETAKKTEGRRKLLALFTQKALFTDAPGAAVWLGKVAALYKDASASDKVHIRSKVQEFCEGFIPATAKLDDTVILKEKGYERAKISIKYRDDKNESKFAPLSSDPNGLTEYNAAMRYPGTTTFAAIDMKNPEYLELLKPTELSDAAVLYNKLRKAVPPAKDGRKWTVKTIEELKNACEKEKVLVNHLNKLKALNENSEAQILVRLEGLVDGLKAHGELIEGP